MLFQSQHITIHTDDGIATLRLSFPNDAWNLNRICEFDIALQSILNKPHIDVLVIRAVPGRNFSNGYDLEQLAWLHDDAGAFAQQGQITLNHVAQAEMVTVAFIEGACLGPGFELALACDYQLAVAGPNSWIGLAQGLPACWGSSADRRLRRIDLRQCYTAREAVRLGLFDDAFTQRRANIELRLFLDEQQHSPRKRSVRRCRIAESNERIALRQAIEVGLQHVYMPTTHPAVEAAIRGQWVAIESTDNALSLIESAFAEALRRGRVTPLELEQARKQIELRSRHPQYAPSVSLGGKRQLHWGSILHFLGEKLRINRPQKWPGLSDGT